MLNTHGNAPAAGTARGAGEGRGEAPDREYSTEPPAERLLARLEKVKRTGAGRWLACCPAHGDRSPSLSIRETDDGTVLVHCFAGCGAAEVMQAVGLELRDLFPPKAPDARSPLRPGQRWVPRDALEAVAHEALLVVVVADDVHQGRTPTEQDMHRLAQAAGRIRAAAREVGANV
ncbi:hypothetical protein [Thioalkalivibrio sp. ALE9]|uniref:hypothetical protein n=1 Tax=Thioalkalivibrio sp. ALE9 TaxID=1158169 RepID=UPI0003773FB6|nr:hypothetical protein [Thioalkalivibrio sp. ALE9]